MNRLKEKMTIGRTAKQAGVTIDAIRFYERRGLLPRPTRSANGYRIYSEQTIDRLHFVRRAKDLGFKLDEIASLLALQDEGGAKAQVKKLTTEKLAKVEQKISDLQRMRDTLRALNNQCSGSGSIRNCPIIETLTSTNDPRA
jgi:MerR family copper efflux transcriptional regulator